MDDKSLIKLVKENPILYNRNSTTSKIKEEKDKAWTQIATKLNKTPEEARWRWFRLQKIRRSKNQQQHEDPNFSMILKRISSLEKQLTPNRPKADVKNEASVDLNSTEILNEMAFLDNCVTQKRTIASTSQVHKTDTKKTLRVLSTSSSFDLQVLTKLIITCFLKKNSRDLIKYHFISSIANISQADEEPMASTSTQSEPPLVDSDKTALIKKLEEVLMNSRPPANIKEEEESRSESEDEMSTKIAQIIASKLKGKGKRSNTGRENGNHTCQKCCQQAPGERTTEVEFCNLVSSLLAQLSNEDKTEKMREIMDILLE